jgi:hypothetical protein
MHRAYPNRERCHARMGNHTRMNCKHCKERVVESTYKRGIWIHAYPKSIYCQAFYPNLKATPNIPIGRVYVWNTQ